MTCQSLNNINPTTNLSYSCIGTCADGFEKNLITGACQGIQNISFIDSRLFKYSNLFRIIKYKIKLLKSIGFIRRQ